MRQSAAEVIRRSAREDLRLACEAAKCACLYDAITVTLEGSAIIARRCGKSTRGKPVLIFPKDTTSMQIVNHYFKFSVIPLA
jgi:hypothetical protein